MVAGWLTHPTATHVNAKDALLSDVWTAVAVVDSRRIRIGARHANATVSVNNLTSSDMRPYSLCLAVCGTFQWWHLQNISKTCHQCVLFVWPDVSGLYNIPTDCRATISVIVVPWWQATTTLFTRISSFICSWPHFRKFWKKKTRKSLINGALIDWLVVQANLCLPGALLHVHEGNYCHYFLMAMTTQNLCAVFWHFC
mgnify:FL=1